MEAMIFPARGQRLRSMGLDVGGVRIGIALSDETGLIAQGLATLERAGWKRDLQYLASVAEKYEVNQVVIGNPLNLDGSSGRQAERIVDFASRLRESTRLQVVLWDERFTSLSAERVLIEGGVRRERRKQVIDQMAAAIMLQSYLDSQNRHAGSGRCQ